MKNFIAFSLVVILNTIYFILNTGPVHAAEQSLRVSPVIINVPLSPGKLHTHQVTIENLTDNPMPLRASLNDFMTSGEEGGYVFEETSDNPLLSWIKLNETEFILKPQERRTLQMTITTPTSIPLGGYYGVLFFEPVVQNQSLASTRISSKIGVLMLANVGVPDPHAEKAEIVDFSTDVIANGSTLPLLLRVKNISLNFFTAKPILTISPLIVIPDLIRDLDSHFHENDKSLTFEDKIIFPGQIRRWTEQPTIEDLKPNIYKAHLTVSTGDGQSIAMDRYFVIFPFVKALIGSVLLSLIIFLFVSRKRLAKAIHELYR